MCLDVLDETIKAPKEGIMWKVFCADGSGFRGEYFHCTTNYTLNTWLKARKLTGGESLDYNVGFHGFKRKCDAREWQEQLSCLRIKKVKYRNVVATGFQDELAVIVAKEIFIPKQ